MGGATTSTANIVALGGEVGGMASATQIDFFTAPTTNVDTGTLRMMINGAGKVGIGTSTPTAQLQIATASADGEVWEYLPGVVGLDSLTTLDYKPSLPVAREVKIFRPT